jgi:Dicarboxylate transport
MLIMSMKSISKKILLASSFTLLFLMILLAFLPTIIETQIRKKVSQSLKLDDFQISINKLGFSNINAGRISTGKSLEIDSVHIDYSLGSLINKKIDQVQISGLTIKANIDGDNQITFEDLNLKSTNKDVKDKGKTEFTNLAFLPEKIKLKNSKIIFTLSSKQGLKQIVVPFEITSSIKTEKKILLADTVLMILGEAFNIDAVLDLTKSIHNIKIDSKTLDLTSLLPTIKYFVPDIKIPDNILLDLTSDLTIRDEILKAHGNIGIGNPFITPLKIKYKSSLNIKTFDTLSFEAENEKLDKMKFSSNNQDIILNKPFYKMTLKGAPLKAEGNFFIGCSKAGIIFEDKNINANRIKVKSHFNYDFTKTGKGISISSVAGLKKISVESSEHKIKISGINARFPFSIPYTTIRQAAVGKFNINSCIIDETYEAKVSGSLTQIETGLLSKGSVSLPDIKDFKLGFDVKAVMVLEDGIKVNSDFHSKPFQFSSDNLAKFIPKQAEGIIFDLNLSSTGKMDYSTEGIKSNLKIDIKDGTVSIPESKLTVNGLATNLEIKDLLTFQSRPAQVLSIDSIGLNDIVMNEAIIKYNIESQDSLFVESTKIKWCKGIVSSEAFRLPSKDNNYSITLYCDRLELTDILEQIGAFHAEGNGTMSGRIPVTYKDGEIAFDNGFLFSTPGKGGKIIVDKADKLTAGIPMDSPQFSQLDLAKEALKNYDYKWAKLNFNTFEDTLLVNMQFDGEPSSKVLPFEYKKELGRFVRVDASNPGSHFQGIKLDVNFKLPFNQVMKFGNKIKKAFK